MNKKAQEVFTIMQYIPRIIFLVIVLFSIIFITRKYVHDNLNVQEIQAEVFVDRILYSPNGILYFNPETKSEVPGIIDLFKFKNETLDEMMNYKDDNFIAAKLDLLDINGKVATASYNSKTYDKWFNLVKTGTTGSGAITEFRKSALVLYYIKGKIKSGTLIFSILMPGK